ncbi:hypothetical protein [Komagataeibacter saccharivorans]|nr:hypothetical protein [Komagataeibacter saccharivorans]
MPPVAARAAGWADGCAQVCAGRMLACSRTGALPRPLHPHGPPA